MPSKYTHRIRVSDEELDLVNELRLQRLKNLPNQVHANVQSAIAAAEVRNQGGTAKTGAVFGAEPEPTKMIAGELREEKVSEITSSRIGIISDVHWPFHDLKQDESGNYYGAYLTAIEWLREQNIGTLILNGDMLDCFNLSAHEKVEGKRSWKWELDVSRVMVKHLREYFGDKVRIVYREGNHEERFKRYLAGKAKELEGSIWLDELLELRKHGIEWVQDRDKIVAGKLWIDHGHEWFGSGGVNPARNYRMKSVDNVIVGHVHKTSTDLFRKPLDGSFIAGWSVGCLCDLNPRYAPRNNWNHGVALVELEADGNFTVHNKVILQGKVR